MILSRSGITFPWLSWSVICLSGPSFSVLQTFLRLFDITIVSRMISWLYFLMSFLAFFLMVMHISAYSTRCLSSPFPTISRRFIRARVGDDVLDFSGLLIALATFDALYWIMSVMVSLMVSTSCSSCSVSNRFLNSSWNSIFDPICAGSTLGGLLVIHISLSPSTSNLMLLIAILYSLPMLIWLMTVTFVTMSGLCARM